MSYPLSVHGYIFKIKIFLATLYSYICYRENKLFHEYNYMIHFYDTFTGPATITNGEGPVLGGKPFLLTGPCLNRVQNHNIRCRMGQTDVTGSKTYDSNNNFFMVQCIPPLSLQAGPVAVGLSIDRGRTYPFTANYTYGKATFI